MVRIEHWDVAYDQGRVAALNILKKRIPYVTTVYVRTVNDFLVALL